MARRTRPGDLMMEGTALEIFVHEVPEAKRPKSGTTPSPSSPGAAGWFTLARSRRPGQQGFTLLELIIVIAIIGILAAAAMPAMRNVPRKAKEATLKSTLHTLRDLLDQHYADKGHYPSTLDALVEEGYLRALPRDPFTGTDEWGVVYEEYDSEEIPAETDVDESGAPGIWDVYSLSEDRELNGETFYSDW